MLTQVLFLLIELEIFAKRAEGNEIKKSLQISPKKYWNDKGLVSRLIVSIECEVPGGVGGCVGGGN